MAPRGKAPQAGLELVARDGVGGDGQPLSAGHRQSAESDNCLRQRAAVGRGIQHLAIRAPGLDRARARGGRRRPRPRARWRPTRPRARRESRSPRRRRPSSAPLASRSRAPAFPMGWTHRSCPVPVSARRGEYRPARARFATRPPRWRAPARCSRRGCAPRTVRSRATTRTASPPSARCPPRALPPAPPG